MVLEDALVEYVVRTRGRTDIRRSNKMAIPRNGSVFELLPALAEAEEYRLESDGVAVDNVTVTLSFPLPGEGNYMMTFSTAL